MTRNLLIMLNLHSCFCVCGFGVEFGRVCVDFLCVIVFYQFCTAETIEREETRGWTGGVKKNKFKVQISQLQRKNCILIEQRVEVCLVCLLK